MSPKATVHKCELSISDMDRHYYATHALTIAQHPSETADRAMVRVATFALFADERLEFGRGLSSTDEPDLWRKSLTGDVEQWIDLGQPEEARIRRACGRSREVVVVGYSGRGFGIWWAKNADALARCANLTVIELGAGVAESLAPMLKRNMQVQTLVQDGEVQWSDEATTVAFTPVVHMRSGVRS